MPRGVRLANGEGRMLVSCRLPESYVSAIKIRAAQMGARVTLSEALVDMLGPVVTQLLARVSSPDLSSTGVGNTSQGGSTSETEEAPKEKQEHLDQRTRVRGGSRKPVEMPAIPDWLAELPEWKDWQQHRREKGQTLKPTTVRHQLRQLEAWRAQGQSVAAILRYSITNGYTGLFEERAATKAIIRSRPSAPDFTSATYHDDGE